MKDIFKGLIINVIVSLTVCVGVVYIYHKKFSPHIVVFNIDQFIAEQVKIKQQGGNVDDNLMAVKKYIDELPENTIVLPNTVVLHGGKQIEHNRISKK